MDCLGLDSSVAPAHASCAHVSRFARLAAAASCACRRRRSRAAARACNMAVGEFADLLASARKGRVSVVESLAVEFPDCSQERRVNRGDAVSSCTVHGQGASSAGVGSCFCRGGLLHCARPGCIFGQVQAHASAGVSSCTVRGLGVSLAGAGSCFCRGRLLRCAWPGRIFCRGSLVL